MKRIAESKLSNNVTASSLQADQIILIMSFTEAKSPTLKVHLLKSSVSLQADSVRKVLKDLKDALQDFKRIRLHSDSAEIRLSAITRVQTLSKEAEQAIQELEACAPEARIDKDFKASMVKQLGKDLETLLKSVEKELVQAECEDRKTVEQTEGQMQRTDLVSALAFEESLLQDRNLEIQSIESSLVEIHEIMQDTTSLVAQQGEGLDRLDQFVTETVHNTSQAAMEMDKAETYQRRSRSRTCCLLVLAAAVLAAVIVLASLASKL